MLIAHLCPTLFDPLDCSLPGSSVHGILQARILEWVAISYSGGSSQPGDWTQVFHIAGRFLTVWATREAPWDSIREVAQSCPTLCNPMDSSPPGSFLHGILQARILEWAAISFSRGFSPLRNRTWVSCTAGRRFNFWATREAHKTA